MTRPDSWEGAIVRGRDRRKGRVVADHRPMLRRERASALVVHWDDDRTSTVARHAVTMLKPPLHFEEVVTPIREEAPLERFGPLWAFVICGTCAAVLLAGLAFYMVSGAR
ncbi:membrane protein [Microbacterium phage Gingerbug]|nr:membrane protein [Microbacterium phage Gingerbug]